MSLLCLALLATLAGSILNAEVVLRSAKIGDTTVQYKVVLPTGFSASKEYPAVIAFPGGPQTLETVDTTIQRNWRTEAERRGYIVVVPSSPGGDLFFEDGERIFPEFLKKILADYKIRERKFYVAGLSNGGISAFNIAAEYPSYFWSIVAFPGYLPAAKDARIQAISGMCIYMHVGEADGREWVAAMKDQFDLYRKRGMKVQFTLEKGQPHRIETLAGVQSARLFDEFEESRKSCGTVR